jgi:hypothetical protein
MAGRAKAETTYSAVICAAMGGIELWSAVSTDDTRAITTNKPITNRTIPKTPGLYRPGHVKTLRSQKLRMPEIIAKPELCCLLRCVDRYWHFSDMPNHQPNVSYWG